MISYAGRRSTLKWFRAGKALGALRGFLVSWDVDSRDRSACARLQRFVYGFTSISDGRRYRYPGFVARDGVRYIGQSVLLVRNDRLPELVAGLAEIGVDFDLVPGSLG